MTRINADPVSLQFLTDRTIVSPDQFRQLPDAARLRAFTVARQTEAGLLQQTLDALKAHVADGGTFGTFRENNPDLVETLTAESGDRHVRLIIEQNTRQAQAVGAYQQRQELKAAFPYVKYHTGVNPRPSHAALNGKIFGVDDPFLLAHTPPWEFGCNCDLWPQTAKQAGQARALDKNRPLEQQQVVPGNSQLENLASRNKMPHPQSGAIHAVDMRPPALKGGDYSFRPDQLNQAVDLSGYDAAVRQRLAGELKSLGYEISGDGLSALPPPTSPPPGLAPMKHHRVGKPVKRVERAGRLVAFKAGPGAAAGVLGGLQAPGRGHRRVGEPAPQIARVAFPRKEAA